MCGRTCLTLQPHEIIKACRCKHLKPAKISEMNEHSNIGGTKNDKVSSDTHCKLDEHQHDILEPEWRSEYNCGRVYTPSYNIAPTDITPVLVSKHHFCEEDAKDMSNSCVIVPMMWGMIPFWHRGDYRKHGLTTNNCRLEHMLESKLYRGPFRRGQRCAILCEGFYEWQTTVSAKPSERAAHLLFMPQTQQIKIYDRNTWQPQDITLLKMAGLFDVWEDEQGDKIYSYSVITFESSKIMSWLHHRMPAILETEEQLKNWLDFKNVSDDQALSSLRPCKQLEWYRVSNLVNNSRNKSEKCNKPLELIKQEKPPMNKMMSAWLNIRKRHEVVLGEDEKQSIGGDATTTSESESELPDAKRARYREFKQCTARTSKDTNNVTESTYKKDNGDGQT